MNYKELMLLSR